VEVPLDLLDLWCTLAQPYVWYTPHSYITLITISTSPMATVCCEPRVGYLQLVAMFKASAAGAETGRIEHWTCSYCSIMHLEESSTAPEHVADAEPGPMEVDPRTERSPIGLYANDRDQNIAPVEEEITRVSSLPPTIQAPFTRRSSPPLTTGATNPTYVTPLYLHSIQGQTHSTPGPGVSEPLPLLASLFPRNQRTSDCEGVFTRRGARSRATGLFKHLCSPIDPSNPRSSALS
jgi:hypothetical protein